MNNPFSLLHSVLVPFKTMQYCIVKVMKSVSNKIWSGVICIKEHCFMWCKHMRFACLCCEPFQSIFLTIVEVSHQHYYVFLKYFLLCLRYDLSFMSSQADLIKWFFSSLSHIEKTYLDWCIIVLTIDILISKSFHWNWFIKNRYWSMPSKLVIP